MAHAWGYAKENGPDTWAENYPSASGSKQTPIDIITSQAQYDDELAKRPLVMNYVPGNALTLSNNGHSCQVSYNSDGSSLEGGPLDAKYKLAQFHFHWGKDATEGSEHRVDGHMYAAELHLVHWNAERFPTVMQALLSGDTEGALCVLGVFLKPGNPHKGLQVLTDLVSDIAHKGDSVKLENGFDPASLLPADCTSYWTYPGSLTTPPCSESVTWVVFKEPIEVSILQLSKFRHLLCHDKEEGASKHGSSQILHNYRPPLALNDRAVRASFQHSAH